MSRDLFTNWAGEKSSAPLRGGRAAGKGDRKHTGISSLCLENALYPLCICSGEARPDGVRKTQHWMGCTHKLWLWGLYATALPLSLLRGKPLIVTWGRQSRARRLKESGWRQQRKGWALWQCFEDRQRNLWLSVMYIVMFSLTALLSWLYRGKKKTTTQKQWQQLHVKRM